MIHEITLATAVEMTTAFRASQPGGMPLCETFDKASVERLLATTGCTRLRIYYGMKNGNNVHAILVAADSTDHDLLPAISATAGDDGPVILEDSFRCPPDCPPGSPLNPKKP